MSNKKSPGSLEAQASTKPKDAELKTNPTSAKGKKLPSWAVVIITLLISFGALLALIKLNIVKLSTPQTGTEQAQTNKQAEAGDTTENLNSEKDQMGNSSEDTSQKKQGPTEEEHQSFVPKKPIPQTKFTPTPTSTSKYYIPKNIVDSTKTGYNTVKKITTQDYYAYYLGKSEELSKNYPKDTLIFKTSRVEYNQAKKVWYTNHIIIIIPKASVKNNSLEDYAIYKVTVSKDELSFESTEKPSELEYETFKLYTNSHGVSKTQYDTMESGVYYSNFAKIGGKYFKNFVYIKSPHKKNGLFGSTSTYYAFPSYIASKYHMTEEKPYLLLSTGETIELDDNKYMLSGNIEVK